MLKNRFPIHGVNFGFPDYVFYFGIKTSTDKEPFIQLRKNEEFFEINLNDITFDDDNLNVFLKKNYTEIEEFWIGKSNPLKLFKSLKV